MFVFYVTNTAGTGYSPVPEYTHSDQLIQNDIVFTVNQYQNDRFSLNFTEFNDIYTIILNYASR